MLKIEVFKNSDGGIDLLVKPDHKVEYTHLDTGGKELSLKFWKELKSVCEQSIESLEDNDPMYGTKEYENLECNTSDDEIEDRVF